MTRKDKNFSQKQAFPSDASPRAQALLRRVVAPCYQLHRSGGVDNKAPKKSEPLN